MITHEKRCIFIHIPKCAGTSVETAFERRVDVERLLRCAAVFGAIATHPEYFTFTVVRNPWARAVSMWRHSRRLRVGGWSPESGHSHPNAASVGYMAKRWFRKYIYRIDSFSQYLRCIAAFLQRRGLYQRFRAARTIGEFARPLSWQRLNRFDVFHVLPQVFFTRETKPDYICKLEHIDEDWRHVRRQIGMDDVDLPIVNAPDAGRVDSRRPLSRFYSPADIELVRRIYADDIAAFGYGNPPEWV